MRNRSVVFVIRNKKILVEKLNYPSEGKADFYSIPGSGIEEDETPEQAAIRELKEECGLEGVYEEVKSWGEEISYPRAM